MPSPYPTLSRLLALAALIDLSSFIYFFLALVRSLSPLRAGPARACPGLNGRFLCPRLSSAGFLGDLSCSSYSANPSSPLLDLGTLFLDQTTSGSRLFLLRRSTISFFVVVFFIFFLFFFVFFFLSFSLLPAPPSLAFPRRRTCVRSIGYMA